MSTDTILTVLAIMWCLCICSINVEVFTRCGSIMMIYECLSIILFIGLIVALGLMFDKWFDERTRSK